MSIREGNALFRTKRYEEAIQVYKKIDTESPLFRFAQQNIKIAADLLARKGNSVHFEEAQCSEEPKIHEIKIDNASEQKGIPRGDCLTAKVSGLKKKHYYSITIKFKARINGVISVRDTNRNLPLYQSAKKDITDSSHVFFVPPSISPNISISVHTTDLTIPLSELSEKILLAHECLGHIDEVTFKPATSKPIVASMATISSRLNIAVDAATSLLSQVDTVYIHINDAHEVPNELKHKRIIVSTEKTHGDLGDSGKFVGARSAGDAYVLVCDDDFIFPHDYVVQSYLRLAAEDFGVVVGMHGIYLRYPIEDYYAHDARNTMHYSTGFSFNTTVSAVGTGAILFDTMRFPMQQFVLDFKNMADIWFALECNRLGIPILIQERHANWLIDNPPSEMANAIWKHSATNTVSAANTRAMQTYVLSAENSSLYSLPLVSSLSGKDYILSISYSDFLASSKTLEKLSKTSYSPSVIFVYDCIDVPAARASARSIYTDLVFYKTRLNAEELQSKFSAHSFSFLLDTENIIASEHQLKRIIDVFRSSGKYLTTRLDIAILATNKSVNSSIRYIPKPSGPQPWPQKTDARISAAVTRDILKIVNASNTVALQNTVSPIVPTGKHTEVPSKHNIAKYFDRIYLLNLDRRPDRLEQFYQRATKWGIDFERVSAIDGSIGEVLEEYKTIQQRLKLLYGPLKHQFKYESSSYWEYQSEGERISHLLQKNGRTYSNGGYGYLKTYKIILEDAIKSGYNRIAVFDDDCLFHKDLGSLFDAFIKSVPDDWVTLSLGALQYEWRDQYVGWWAKNAFRCGGHSVGSHAQAYSKMAFPMLLEHIHRFTLPFDVGALHYLKRYYSTKSFTAFPNLFIQDVADTDIGDSTVQLTEGTKKNNVYKWVLSNYE